MELCFCSPGTDSLTCISYPPNTNALTVLRQVGVDTAPLGFRGMVFLPVRVIRNVNPDFRCRTIESYFLAFNSARLLSGIA